MTFAKFFTTPLTPPPGRFNAHGNMNRYEGLRPTLCVTKDLSRPLPKYLMRKGPAASPGVALSSVSEADEQPGLPMPKCTEAKIDKEDVRAEKQGTAGS